jgi:hypothetical protein
MEDRYQVLVPDLNATEWIDLVEAKIKAEIRSAEYVLNEIKEGNQKKVTEEDCHKVIQLANDTLKNYKPGPDAYAVEVGYIPPRKFASLQAHYSKAIKKYNPDNPDDDERLTDYMREFVRWGIKGHKNFKIEYKKEEEKVGPLSYPVATWYMVDLYESSKMLVPIFHEVMRYNTLSESKKKQSSSPYGTTPPHSTVKDAENAHS